MSISRRVIRRNPSLISVVSEIFPMVFQVYPAAITVTQKTHVGFRSIYRVEYRTGTAKTTFHFYNGYSLLKFQTWRTHGNACRKVNNLIISAQSMYFVKINR